MENYTSDGSFLHQNKQGKQICIMNLFRENMTLCRLGIEKAPFSYTGFCEKP